MSAPSLDVAAIRAQFPALQQEIHGRPLAYLDNAASTQKPQAVLDALQSIYGRDYSNVHRGVHTLSVRATERYEAARLTVQRFLNAPEPESCIFTAGTTEAINLIAWTWARANVEAGDQILITHMEHHSNIVPWQMLCEVSGAELVVASMDERGALDREDFRRKLSERTRLVAVVHVSNALGTVNPIAELVQEAHAAGARVLVDGAQAAPHTRVDVQALGCDFYTFSGHKVYGPTGIGVLWGRRELLEAMPPWQGGGDMIESVSFEGTTYAGLPSRLEAGTPHIAGAVGLAAALQWVEGVGIDTIAAHEARLLERATTAVSRVPGVRLVGTAPERAGVLSFVLEGIHSHDVGQFCDSVGVAVRVGHHCAQPVMDFFGVPATTRASFAAYNHDEDIEALVAGLQEARDLLG